MEVTITLVRKDKKINVQFLATDKVADVIKAATELFNLPLESFVLITEHDDILKQETFLDKDTFDGIEINVFIISYSQ